MVAHIGGMGMAAANRIVSISKLSDLDLRRIQAALNKFVADRKVSIRDEALSSVPQEIFGKRLLVKVSGYKNVSSYVRAAPGAKRIVDVLGKESFFLFGALIAVALQAWEDSQRDDLSGSQKLGRTSLALLGFALGAEFPPLGLLLLALVLVFPNQYDRVTAAAFSDKDPVVQKMAGAMVKIGAKGFEQWRVTPGWVELR